MERATGVEHALQDAFLGLQGALAQASTLQIGHHLLHLFLDGTDALLGAPVAARGAAQLLQGLEDAALLGAQPGHLLAHALAARLLPLGQRLLGSLVELGLLLGESEHLLHGLAKTGRHARLGEILQALHEQEDRFVEVAHGRGLRLVRPGNVLLTQMSGGFLHAEQGIAQGGDERVFQGHGLAAHAADLLGHPGDTLHEGELLLGEGSGQLLAFVGDVAQFFLTARQAEEVAHGPLDVAGQLLLLFGDELLLHLQHGVGQGTQVLLQAGPLSAGLGGGLGLHLLDHLLHAAAEVLLLHGRGLGGQLFGGLLAERLHGLAQGFQLLLQTLGVALQAALLGREPVAVAALLQLLVDLRLPLFQVGGLLHGGFEPLFGAHLFEQGDGAVQTFLEGLLVFVELA